MITKILGALGVKTDAAKQAAYNREIRREGRIGGRLFGPVPAGTRREFFCLDEHTWVWHEEWSDGNGLHHVRSTRYDIRPNGIFKIIDDNPRELVAQHEAHNLLAAIRAYNATLDAELAPLLGVAA